jgi:nucleotide-binding universal stress UspA family protein
MSINAMKLMLAYGGTVHADAAIDDLLRAGLPHEGRAWVVSVADAPAETSLPPADEVSIFGSGLSTTRLEATIDLVRQERARLRSEARSNSESGAERFRSIFPGWRVSRHAVLGEPANELLRLAGRFKPDLVVLGSTSRGTISRLFFGSVHERVVAAATITVRIARRDAVEDAARPIELVVGYSSPAESIKISRAAELRSWPAGSTAYVFNTGTADESLAANLRSRGLDVRTHSFEGDLASVLLQCAKEQRADAIIVADPSVDGATLTETARRLIAEAECSVEVVW